MPEKKDELDEKFWDENSEEDPLKKSKEEGEEGGEEGGEGEKEKVKVGEKEIPVDELADLVAKGEDYGALQKKYPSIKFDGLAKDYTEKSSRLSELEKKDKVEVEEKKKTDTDQREDVAKKQVMGILGPEIKKIIKEEFEGFSAENSYEGMVKKLQKEFTGEDKKPKFEREEIEKYMEEVGIANPKIAYEYKFKDELREWEKENEKDEDKKIPFSEKLSGGGMHIPKPKKLETFEDAENASDELLKGSE